MLVLYWILVVVMLVGIIGAVVPALPGSSLILGAILVWGVVNGFRDVGLALGVTIAVLLISVGIDFLSAYLGAKQAGASRWGQTGAMIGLVLGFLGFLPREAGLKPRRSRRIIVCYNNLSWSDNDKHDCL
jgi:uncharacterized protein YqgC (DUF456 family)